MKFILILMPLFLFSCMGKDVDIPLNFEGARLVLFSKLEANKPITVEVKKTFAPIGEVPLTSVVNNAKVSVYQNGMLYANLHETEESGIYSSDVIILGNHSYSIKAEVNGLSKVESDLVIVPSKIPDFRYTITEDVYSEYSSTRLQNLATIFFAKNDEPYLELIIRGHYNNNYRPVSAWYSSTSVSVREEDCREIRATSEFSSLILNGSCIKENTSIKGYISKVASSIDREPLKFMTLTLSSISKEWFEYNKVLGNQPEGLDHMILQSKPVYTNIKNGYGLVYGYNGSEFVLK